VCNNSVSVCFDSSRGMKGGSLKKFCSDPINGARSKEVPDVQESHIMLHIFILKVIGMLVCYTKVDANLKYTVSLSVFAICVNFIVLYSFYKRSYILRVTNYSNDCI